MFEKSQTRRVLVVPFLFLGTIWLVHITSVLLDWRLLEFGIQPRTLRGLASVVTAPFNHGDFSHLASNSLPLLMLSSGIFYLYRMVAWRVVISIYVLGGLAVWLFARPSFHLGASGMNYGFVSFLFFSGFFHKHTRSIALALIVTFLYGSMIWGVLPLEKGVSWETHLFCAIVGLGCATYYRNAQFFEQDLAVPDYLHDEELARMEQDYWDPDNWKRE